MPWAKCRKSTERTVDFYLTECKEIDDIAQALGFDTRSDWVRAASLGSSVIVLAGGVDPSTPTATDDEK